jgi:hypothetical protein
MAVGREGGSSVFGDNTSEMFRILGMMSGGQDRGGGLIQ